MATKRFLRRKSTAPNPESSTLESVSEIAVAGIISSQNQSQVHAFITYITKALERNSVFINNLVQKNPSFKCVLLTGSGPDCFKVKNVIYPSDETFKLEIELLDCEDYDKIGVAALVRITPTELNSLQEYLKYGVHENAVLHKDMLEGKNNGISFVVLKPFIDGQFKVIEKLSIDSSSSLTRKRKNAENFLTSIKKIRKVI